MLESTIRQPLHRARISRVFIGAKDNSAAGLDDTAEQLLDLCLGCFRVRSSKLLFEDPPFHVLSRPHRAAAPQLSIIEPVDKMRCADQEIDVHGPVLAVLEGSKAVEDERLGGRPLGAMLLMKEKTVASEAIREAPHGRVRDARFSGDLTKSGARHQAVEDGFEEVASAEPVVGGKGL